MSSSFCSPKRTGVNVTGNQRVVFTGLTDAAANSEWGCNNSGSQAEAACGQHRQAIAEAEAASGLEVSDWVLDKDKQN